MFIAHRKNKNTGDALSGSTLKNYVAGIQRGFRKEWGFNLDLFDDPVFADRNDGLMCALDNKIRDLQAKGMVRKSHNVLAEEDIVKLYQSSALSKDHARGCMTRLIFNVAFMTAMRPGELAGLRMQDFSVLTSGNEEVLRIVGTIGDLNGKSKTSKGGLRASNDKPMEIFVWNRTQVNGIVNVFQDIKSYMDIVSTFRLPTDRFFCAINYRSSDPRRFFMNGNLGKNSFRKYVQDACTIAGVVGQGVSDHMVTHGLRGTVITRLFESGFADASVALRSGHRDFRSFKSYHNLCGNLGKQQQQAILGSAHSNEDSMNENVLEQKEMELENMASIARDAKRQKMTDENPGTSPIGGVGSIGSIAGNVSINIYYGSNTSNVGPEP